MGNSLRCCLACVLPCGALDLIRIVHLNGNVEEITRPITAGEVLKENPNHVLSKPCSQGMVRKILILSPASELKRGSIYFLIPASSLPPEKNKKKKKNPTHIKKTKKCTTTNTTITDHHHDVTPLHDDQRHLKKEEIISSSEKKSSSHRRERRRSSSGVWKPHLDSIFEEQ